MENDWKGKVTVKRSFGSLAEFYPFYLSQHTSRTNRLFHFVGTTVVVLSICIVAISGEPRVLFAVPSAGYGLAWFGHFAFEKNKPATFQYPFYSLVCDFVMYRDMLLGRIKF